MKFPEQILVVKKFIEVLEELYPAPSVLTTLLIDGELKSVHKKKDPPFCAYYVRKTKYWYIICRDYWVFKDTDNEVPNFCSEFEKEYGAIMLFCHASPIGIKSRYHNNPDYIFIGKATF